MYNTSIPLITFGFIVLVGSEDGHEELLAAVKAVTNSGMNLIKYYLIVYPLYLSDGVVLYFLITTASSFSSQFWRQMELFFGLITEEDIAYWKQKVLILFPVGEEVIAFLLVLSYIRKMLWICDVNNSMALMCPLIELELLFFL